MVYCTLSAMAFCRLLSQEKNGVLSLIQVTVSFCLHSLAGSRNQSFAGCLYVVHQGDLSGLLLHAHSLKYLLRGKNQQQFWPQALFRPESIVSD